MIAAPLSAQVAPFSCRVVDEKGASVPYAGVWWKSVRDSADAGGETADSNGKIHMKLMRGIRYSVYAAATSYAGDTVNFLADTLKPSLLIRLASSTHMLKGALIKAGRPLMHQEDDKTVIDPEALSAASSSGYEVLEKTPGITADQDGNFYLASSTPATVYINGREMKMSNADVASMLKSLPPSSIAKIEILRTPSAKYDASGSGGIINIVLKKGVKLGLTGSVNAGIQQGVYGNQFGGFSLSYTDGWKTAYLNMNYARRKSGEHISSLRLLSPDSSLAQDAGSVYSSGNLFIGYGLGKTWGKAWDISYDGRVSNTVSHNSTGSRSTILQGLPEETVSDNYSNSINNIHSLNIDQSVDATYKLDTAGSEWTAGVSWNGTFGHTIQDILSTFRMPTFMEGADNGDIRTSRNYFTGQTDLKKKWPHGITLETGLKASWMEYNHGSDYMATYKGITLPDPYRSGSYHYTEHINAAYVQVSKGFGSIVVKPGVRVEQTIMDGVQTRPGNTSFVIKRTDLFPYLFISRKVMTIAGFDLKAYLVYRRTIMRPAYDYLNPFQHYVDQYLYETGNPSLRPQFTQNYEANISIDERPLFAVGYNDIRDIFSQVVYQSDSDKSVAYRTYDNLGANKETYIRGLAGIPPGHTYFFIAGAQYSHSNYDGSYNSAPLQYGRSSWTFFTYHNLKLGKKTNIVVNGFMRLNALMQFYELGAFGNLNASISRYFLDKKLMVTLNAQDIFFTNRYDYTIHQGAINASGSRYNDSQRFGINVRYNFGIRRKEEKKDFMNTSDPEKKEE